VRHGSGAVTDARVVTATAGFVIVVTPIAFSRQCHRRTPIYRQPNASPNVVIEEFSANGQNTPRQYAMPSLNRL